MALDGKVGIHDPSTICMCSGKFYTYGTGGNARADGARAAVRSNVTGHEATSPSSVRPIPRGAAPRNEPAQ